jgi:hypothetical protein
VVYSISKQLYEVGDALAHASSDIKDLAHDLEIFAEELTLHATLVNAGNSHYSDQVNRLTAKIIGRCATICVKIDRILKKVRSGGVLAKLKWIYKERELKKLLDRLRDLKLSLMGTLSHLRSLKADYMMDKLGVGNPSLLKGAEDEAMSKETMEDIEETRRRLAEVSMGSKPEGSIYGTTLTSQDNWKFTGSGKIEQKGISREVPLAEDTCSFRSTSSTQLDSSVPLLSETNISDSSLFISNAAFPRTNTILQNPSTMESVQSFHSALSYQSNASQDTPWRNFKSPLVVMTTDYAPTPPSDVWMTDMVGLAMKHFSMSPEEATTWALSLPEPISRQCPPPIPRKITLTPSVCEDDSSTSKIGLSVPPRQFTELGRLDKSINPSDLTTAAGQDQLTIPNGGYGSSFSNNFNAHAPNPSATFSQNIASFNDDELLDSLESSGPVAMQNDKGYFGMEFDFPQSRYQDCSALLSDDLIRSSSIPMSIPESRDPVQPPLSTPRHLADVSESLCFQCNRFKSISRPLDSKSENCSCVKVETNTNSGEYLSLPLAPEEPMDNNFNQIWISPGKFERLAAMGNSEERRENTHLRNHISHGMHQSGFADYQPPPTVREKRAQGWKDSRASIGEDGFASAEKSDGNIKRGSCSTHLEDMGSPPRNSALCSKSDPMDPRKLRDLSKSRSYARGQSTSSGYDSDLDVTRSGVNVRKRTLEERAVRPIKDELSANAFRGWSQGDPSINQNALRGPTVSPDAKVEGRIPTKTDDPLALPAGSEPTIFSCTPCRRSKIRCNETAPCSRCSSKNFEYFFSARSLHARSRVQEKRDSLQYEPKQIPSLPTYSKINFVPSRLLVRPAHHPDTDSDDNVFKMPLSGVNPTFSARL